MTRPCFRPRSPSPRFVGGRSAEADTWLVGIEFADGKEPVRALVHASEWTPSLQQWQEITARSVESPAKVTIVGVNKAARGQAAFVRHDPHQHVEGRGRRAAVSTGK